MRFFLLFATMLTIIFYACKKGVTNPGGGNTGGTSPGGGITITAVSPLIAYQGDIITVTGTGFEPDKTKDTVLIGIKADVSGVVDFYPGAGGISNSNTTIISATAEEIKFRTDSTMVITGAITGDVKKFAIRVSSGSKSVYTSDTVQLKVYPHLFNMSFTDPYTLPCNGYETWAGDSLYLNGQGLYPPVIVKIDGKQIDNTRYIDEGGLSPEGRGTVVGFINIDFFGMTTPPGDCQANLQLKDIEVINADGRSAKLLQMPFFPGPNTHITEVYMDQPSYKRSGGTNALLTMTGYAIRNFTLFVKGVDNADQTVFTESLAGQSGDLTGPFTTSIDLLALPIPKSSAGAGYQIQVKDENGVTLAAPAFTLYK